MNWKQQVMEKTKGKSVFSTEILILRIDPKLKEDIRKSSKLTGRTMSRFVKEVLHAKTRQIISLLGEPSHEELIEAEENKIQEFEQNPER
jgi:uncharacterized protein (DUF1778 family)